MQMDKSSFCDINGKPLSLEQVTEIETKSNLDVTPPAKEGWTAMWKAFHGGWVYVKRGGLIIQRVYSDGSPRT